MLALSKQSKCCWHNSAELLILVLVLFFLQALAASGLRAIRYAVEVDGIGEVTAVDNNEGALVTFSISIVDIL
jgi:tRNA G26 N,N-dimethylase Trm1